MPYIYLFVFIYTFTRVNFFESGNFGSRGTVGSDTLLLEVLALLMYLFKRVKQNEHNRNEAFPFRKYIMPFEIQAKNRCNPYVEL